MGWNAVPGLLIITGVWAGAAFAIEQISVFREEKTLWAYNKDYYQRALLRRDWYLHREQETLESAK
eukprot:CAMPEP_0202863172 /NCGR_PEP_ID=MMETSP1391-20130828/3916_1 /ASSEMBLY_ACC=CAM_ASM_000867 /TAXON_ID=1034604 /ORGANISM="Chlamydomonas leiostraca, Strain SAG 11-49" /LENGTH=65 /DNA_ID=CAMNT_0049542779 /DNA_START=21 /DNA_END=218 /DNA_ORIENTATION=-